MPSDLQRPLLLLELTVVVLLPSDQTRRVDAQRRESTSARAVCRSTLRSGHTGNRGKRERNHHGARERVHVDQGL